MYIDSNKVFTKSLELFPNGSDLFAFIDVDDPQEGYYWNKLKLEYESECADSK